MHEYLLYKQINVLALIMKKNSPIDCWWQSLSVGHYGACEEGASFTASSGEV